MDNSNEQLNNKSDRRGIHPNSLKNLETGRQKGWKKGHSGNPNGQSLTSLVKKLLNEIPNVAIDKKVNTKSWRELIVQAWLVGSYKGNATLFKELLERVEGKVAQPLTGADGAPLIPAPIIEYLLPDGTVFKLPRNGNREALTKVDSDGDGHTPTG